MRISLIISSLGSGGAERVLTGIANFLQIKGYQVTIITYIGDVKDHYALDPEIKRVRLDCASISKNFIEGSINSLKRIKKIRKAITDSQPNCVISFMDRCNILTLLACSGTGIPVIISERTNPIYYPIGKFWALLRRLLYRKAKYLVIQTEGLRPWAQDHISNDSIAVIPNALDANRLSEIYYAKTLVNEKSERKSIIAMGRFTSEKGHDLLLHSIKPLLNDYPDWVLEIIGDGPLKPALVQLVKDFNLQDSVIFHGQVSNPFNLLKNANIFVLPSRIEGFPNALLEAMALGLPCISFNCPSGPSDMIENNYNGILVEKENVEFMTEAIRRCIDSEELRLSFGSKAENIVNNYTESKIMAQWDLLLRSFV